jgi:TolB-like protein/Flp pilus assembly protein TadD
VASTSTFARQSKMADIFISYSKGFQAQTEQLANELRAKGFTVWYDSGLVPGDSFRDVIMSELAQAQAVIVIWNAASVKSEWVCSEASRARARRILIPVRADDIRSHDIPPPFDALHTELLSNRAAIDTALGKLGVAPTLAMKEESPESPKLASAFPDHPSIAVMPFTNMSGDPEQEVFADGLTEDIITALSASHAYPVIARNSTFSYKGTSPDVRKVARELGVRYVIEGSVRSGGDRLRITAQLIDGATGRHVWAESFDRRLADIFEIQDEITARIAATIQPTLERVEGKRYAAERATNINAWGFYQRAMMELHEYTAAGNRRAREFAAKAIKRDPHYALAYVPLAYSHYRDLRTGNADDEDQSEALLNEAARRAIALDDMDAKSHWAMGLAYQASVDYEMSKAELGRALELNPYDAWVRFALGGTLVFAGDPESAIPHLEKAFELNPQDTRVYFLTTLLARAHLNAQHYDDAVAWARRAIGYRAKHASAHLIVASALGHLGRLREARAELAECERLRPGSGQTGLLVHRFQGSNHIRQLGRVYMTRCGRQDGG